MMLQQRDNAKGWSAPGKAKAVIPFDPIPIRTRVLSFLSRSIV